MYVDVHTHLTHEQFASDWQQVINRAEKAGLGAIVVNGLDPISNRKILKMAEEFPTVKPALGIYPLEAVNHLLPDTFELPVKRFPVNEEISFIREQAKAGKIIAVGECGLDGYWVKEDTFKEQERVFEALIGVAMEYDLPVIIHTRKLEVRAGEILASLGCKKVNFHCFGGKVKLAKRYAEEHGWWFSIPANARKNQAFEKMLAELPMDKILTETDAPYLGPAKGERNEPANVVGTIEFLSELRGISVEAARQHVFKNFQTLFSAIG